MNNMRHCLQKRNFDEKVIHCVVRVTGRTGDFL